MTHPLDALRTVKLRITDTGALVLAHPGAAVGSDTLVYAIEQVPADVPASHVVSQVSQLVLVHPTHDEAAWTYRWPDLAGRPPGGMINRYSAAS